MKKIILLLTGVGFFLTACSENSTSSSVEIGSEPLTFSFQVSKPIQVDEARKVILLGEPGCANGGVPDTLFETDRYQKYQISNGQLLLWFEDDCDAEAYSGNSSSVLGTWIPQITEVLAPGTTETDCELDTLGGEELISLSITSSSLIVRERAMEFCWADYSKEFKGYNDVAKVEKNGCDQYSITLKDGRVSTWKLLEINPDKLMTVYQVTYNGVTCTKTETSITATTETCAKAWSAYQTREPGGTDFISIDKYYDVLDVDFETCMKNAGWDPNILL